MERIEMMLTLYGIVIAALIICLIFHYRKTEEFLDRYLLVGIFLFWNIILLPLMSIDASNGVMDTYLFDGLIIISAIGRIFISHILIKTHEKITFLGDVEVSPGNTILFIVYLMYFIMDIIGIVTFFVAIFLFIAYIYQLCYYIRK